MLDEIGNRRDRRAGGPAGAPAARLIARHDDQRTRPTSRPSARGRPTSAREVRRTGRPGATPRLADRETPATPSPSPTRSTSSWSAGSTSPPAGGSTDLGGLADRVLATAAPGRGLLDVPLPWPDAPRRFGTPPMDPAQLPEEELIRLAVGVLAHLLPDVPRLDAGGSARAVAAAVAPSVPAARLAGHGRRRTPEPARPGSGRDRLAPDSRRHRPTGRGDDGRALGRLGPQRGHPEVEHRLAPRRGRRPAPRRRSTWPPSRDRLPRPAPRAGARRRRAEQRDEAAALAAEVLRARPGRGPGERRRRRVRPAAPPEPAHGTHPRSRAACASWRGPWSAMLDERPVPQPTRPPRR